MTDTAFNTFSTAFDRHLARDSHDADADRLAAPAELRKVETKLKSLIAAISSGANVPSLHELDQFEDAALVKAKVRAHGRRSLPGSLAQQA